MARAGAEVFVRVTATEGDGFAPPPEAVALLVMEARLMSAAVMV